MIFKNPNLLINKDRFTPCLDDGTQQIYKSNIGQFSPEILF